MANDLAFQADRPISSDMSYLQSALGKMEVALSLVDEAIVWTREDRRVEWCNAAFDRIVDRPHSQVLGADLLEILPLNQLNPTDVSIHSDAHATADAHPVTAVLQGQPLSTSYLFQRSEQTFIVKLSGCCFDRSGEKTAVLAIRDITEQQTERRDRERAA